MDRRTDLLIGATATDIGDFPVDIVVGGFGLVLEKRRDSHDHAALAIAALRHVVLNPGLLDNVQRAVFREPFDGRDLPADGVASLHSAGSRRDSVDMDRARAALRNTATIFCSGQADGVSNYPKQ